MLQDSCVQQEMSFTACLGLHLRVECNQDLGDTLGKNGTRCGAITDVDESLLSPTPFRTECYEETPVCKQ